MKWILCKMNDKLIEIASLVLGVSPADLGPETCATNCAKWDSAKRLMLVVECEIEFEVPKFSLKEVKTIKCLGDLELKLAERGAF